VGETSVTTASQGRRDPDERAAQDGRLTRAARTRAAVVDALLALNERGNVRPTARDIATEAGVSLRSLYVHFDDLEALFVAAAERHTDRLASLVGPLIIQGDLATRIETLLSRHATLYEAGAGVRRAALLQEPFSPALQQALTMGRKLARSTIRQMFAPEIAAAGPEAGDALARALEIATSAATWDALRTFQQLSVEAATDQVREMVLAFFTRWGPSSGNGRQT
jgi:TetR/AcrR family transcriptional regulator, regulator of autoinduction and epiphytic fitness